MNGREVGTRYLVGNGVAPANKLAQDLEGNGANPNDLVFYDPVSGKTLGAGVTYQEVPQLGIAQALDMNGDGMIDTLRPIGSGILDGRSISSVTTDAPNTGLTKIKDTFFRCTQKDTSYSLTFQWRNDDTLDTNLWNQWSYKTVTVKLNDYACDSCDDGIDCAAVACAFKNKFYNIDAESDSNPAFLRRALQFERENNLGVDIYPILKKEVQYCISSYAGACGACNEIDAISGITIKAGNELAADVTVTFAGSVINGSTTRSFYGQQQRIIKLINKAFADNNISGSALAIEGISGSGRPCTDFKVLINSCNTVELLDGTGSAMTPCMAEYDPYDGVEFTSSAACVGCTAGTSFVPNCGVRVVGKPLRVNHSCEQKFDPKSWYFTDVNVVTDNESNFEGWYTRDFQDLVVPNGMGVQYGTMMLNQVASGPGFNYPSGLSDHRGLYNNNEAAELKYNTLGLNFNGLYRSISFQHGLPWNVTYSNNLGAMAKWTSYLLIEETNTSVKADVKAILDPWLASLPVPFGPLDMTGDTQDQTETEVNSAGTVTQAATDDTGSTGEDL